MYCTIPYLEGSCGDEIPSSIGQVVLWRISWFLATAEELEDVAEHDLAYKGELVTLASALPWLLFGGEGQGGSLFYSE